MKIFKVLFFVCQAALFLFLQARASQQLRDFDGSTEKRTVIAHVSRGCASLSKRPGYYILNANHGTWPKNGFCRYLAVRKAINYQLTVQLYNKIGWRGVHSGHLGIAYNAIDENNYDFVYFRPHSSSGCFQTGYVLNGQLRWDGGVSAPCPNGPPRGGRWFTAKVEVRGKNVKIFRDGVLVKSTAAHFTAIGRGGVIVANGYKNIIHFKNLRIISLPSLTLTSQSCRAMNKVGNLYIMNANHGVWPASGFCRVLYPKTVGGLNYEVSAQLYNRIGWKGANSGHLGLMYNAINYNNFDFVYFRPHSAGGCFQTGYVLNGQLKWDGGISSSCPNGQPKGATWFTVRVEVRGSSVSIYRDSVLVRSTRAHFPSKGRGGIIVANGYKNIIHFRKFRLRAIAAHPFTPKSCLATRKSANYYILDANHGSWPGSGFCRALFPKKVNGQHYEVSAELYNQIGWQGVNSGHLGLMYNAIDNNNFDFVYFRPHSAGGCFQTGYVLNGQLKWDGGISSKCPNGQPKGATWFTARVEVRGSSVSIYRDSVLVRSIRAHFSAKGRGGIIVANGYKNIIHFRRFRLRAISAHPFTSQSCLATRKTGNYYILDANHGSWPGSGFCRALFRKKVRGPRYTVSVDLYNANGWTGVNSGHLGLMYNAIDDKNFDFVYFRPHSAGGCFQTGYVLNGQLKWDGGISSNCPNGPPKGAKWFSAKVHVDVLTVKIYRDGVLIRSVKPHFQTVGRGGIIVANGYRNIVHFKNYKIY